MYSLLFSFQLSYEAAAAAVGFSRNLGCLRTLMDLFSTCSFINVIILLHLLLFYFSFFLKSTSWVKCIDCGLTYVLLPGNIFFLFFAAESLFQFPMYFKFSTVNGFIIIIITKKTLFLPFFLLIVSSCVEIDIKLENSCFCTFKATFVTFYMMF